MKPLGDPNTHFWLAKGMARACNVDLSAAMHDDGLTQADWAGMVTRCRSCTQPARCHSRINGESPPTEPPSYCRNGEILRELAKR